MFEAIVEALKQAVNDIWDWAITTAEGLLGIDFATLDPTNGLAFMLVYTDRMNEIAPIYAAMSLVFAGIIAKWTVWGVRHILGWIPTIEG